MEKKEDIKISEMFTNLKLYFQNETYVNIVENTSRGERYWNGFISSLNDESFTFFDVMAHINFPINITNIVSVSVSTKTSPDSIQAKDIWDESRGLR